MMYAKQQINKFDDGYLPYIKREDMDFNYTQKEANTRTRTNNEPIIASNNGLFDRMYGNYEDDRMSGSGNNNKNNNNNNNTNTLKVPNPTSNPSSSSTPGSSILPLNETPLMTPPVNLMGLNTSMFDDSHGSNSNSNSGNNFDSPNLLGTPRTGNLSNPVQLAGASLDYYSNIPEMAKPIYGDVDDIPEDPMSWVPLFSGNDSTIIKQEKDTTPPTSNSNSNSTSNVNENVLLNFLLSQSNSEDIPYLEKVFANEQTSTIKYEVPPSFTTRHSAPDVMLSATTTTTGTSESSPSVHTSSSYSGPSSSSRQITKKDLKRIKNTIAARNSRKRKADKMSKLEERVHQLEMENSKLREHVSDLVSLLSQDKNQTLL